MAWPIFIVMIIRKWVVDENIWTIKDSKTKNDFLNKVRD